MTKPYWYRLLDVWVIVEENSGLSIPFLIGVDKVYTQNSLVGNDPIGALFQGIVFGDALEYCATIEYCGTIAAYRLGLVNRLELIEPYFVNSSGEPTLAYSEREFPINDLPAMVGLMKEQYQELIDAGNFSKRNSIAGIWEPFTASDKRFIERALT